MSDIRAYLLRHGRTTLSPQPEGWAPVGLSVEGKEDALAGATALEQLIVADGWGVNDWPRPDYIATSDLARAEQTADIASQVLGVDKITLAPGLRAYDGDEETVEEYEARSAEALEKIFAAEGLPLIVAHRSTAAYLDLQYGRHYDPDWQPDYSSHALVDEGGLIGIVEGIEDFQLIPIFRAIPASRLAIPGGDRTSSFFTTHTVRRALRAGAPPRRMR